MMAQRTLFNFEIPPGMICKPGPCLKCGLEGPYHSWDCGLTQTEKENWLEMIRSTGRCGNLYCGEIITATCRNCRNTPNEGRGDHKLKVSSKKVVPYRITPKEEE